MFTALPPLRSIACRTARMAAEFLGWTASYNETAQMQPSNETARTTLQMAIGLPFASQLSGGSMAEAKEGHEELVKVFDTEEESEALVVRGLLESAGIE